jgi:hypothetical protein
VRSAGSLPWHPILFAAAVVVTAWLDAAVSPYAALRPLAITILLAAVLTAVGALIARSWQLGGILATAVIAALWSKQLIDAAIGVIGRAGPVIGAIWVLLIVAALGLVMFMVVRRARRPSRDRVTQLLNRTASLLLLATFVFGLISGRLPALIGDFRQGTSLAAWAEQSGGGDAAPAPDLYAILLDGYPRADVLEYAFGIDNSSFVASLEGRGFDVAGAAHSDYLWTHVSVPSALNLAYVEQIPRLADVQEGRAPRQPTLRHTVADNGAFDIARRNGYTAVGIGAGFEEVAPRQADVYVDSGNLNEFEISLLTSTFSAAAVNAVAPDFGSSQLRERIHANLDSLPEIASTRGRPPALVFAHVPAPHQPVVLGEGGAPVVVPLEEGWFADSPTERGQDPAEFADRYRAQLPYLNERILETIDGILAASETPPVIVLFADHGSASVVDWNVTQPADADPARLLERTGILFAALTPDRDGVFPDDVSPVDLFRLLFDAYFGTAHGRATPPVDGGQVEPVDASVLDATSGAR